MMKRKHHCPQGAAGGDANAGTTFSLSAPAILGGLILLNLSTFRASCSNVIKLRQCNEAARRFRESDHAPAPGTGSKPLALEYLADRMDTDDPLHGWVVRTRKEGTSF